MLFEDQQGLPISIKLLEAQKPYHLYNHAPSLSSLIMLKITAEGRAIFSFAESSALDKPHTYDVIINKKLRDGTQESQARLIHYTTVEMKQ